MKTRSINYFLFIVFLFSFFSCQKEDLTSEYIPESKDASQTSTLKRSHSGDGKYDVLGWGCDVVKNMYVEKLPVINNDQIITNFGRGNMMADLLLVCEILQNTGCQQNLMHLPFYNLIPGILKSH